MNKISFLRRWFVFNAVGLVGALVQLTLLKILITWSGLDYLVSTAIAVEFTLLHNFLWHQALTWKDRRCFQPATAMSRFGRFLLTNGMVSVTGNVVFMYSLVGVAHWPPVAANLIAIAICSILNFLLSNSLVFTVARCP